MPFSTGNFDRLLDKATSQILLEPDWDATLQLCDAVRAGEVTPKYAASAVSKKVMDKNSNVCLFALSVAESCMKNCGAKFHEELLTWQFVENLHNLAKKSELPIRTKICALIQAWERAFRNDHKFACVHNTYEAMKREDFTFAETMSESDYMFVSDVAPEWKEDKHCYRCRTEFTTFNRQHHCRHCGQSFCSKCSSKTKTIPKFGIEKEVRVCDTCFDALSNKTSSAGGQASSGTAMDSGSSKAEIKDEDEFMAAYLKSSLAKEAQTPAPVSREDKLKEEEELQLALAISQSEAEASGKPSSSKKSSRDPSPKVKSYTAGGKVADEPKSDELAKYMDRAYWEKKRQEQQKINDAESPKTVAVSAPSKADAIPRMETTSSVAANQQPALNGIYKNEESNETCSMIQHKLDMFLNRMRSNVNRGRNITQDSAVQSAFQELSNLQPILAKMIATNEMQRNHFESQQDQLSLLKDTRETLDSMRDDHQEKLRQEKAERERQMMMQRQQKMEALRGLKQQFLLHRMQQLESERQNQANMQMQQQNYQFQNAGMVPGQMLPGQYPGMQSQSPYGSLGATGAPMQGMVQQQPMGQNMMYPGQQVPGMYNMQQMNASLPPGANAAPPSQNMNQQQTAGNYTMPPQNPQHQQYAVNPAASGVVPGANQQYMQQQYQPMTGAPNQMGQQPNQNYMSNGVNAQPVQQQMGGNAPAALTQPVHTESPLIDFG